MYEEDEPKKKTAWGPIAAAIITAVSAIFVAYINSVAPSAISIHATQTAEAKFAQPAPSFVAETSSPTREALAPSATETPVILPTATATVYSEPDIFSTDKLAGLKPYSSPDSFISFAIVPTFAGEGLEISYRLGENQWTGFFRLVESSMLENTKGVRFSYMGSGAANTLEFKMEYKQGTVFSVLLPHASAKPDWQEEEILYTDLTCWVNTPGCPENLSLNLEPDKVIKIGFAISNKPDFSDEPGEGKVILDEVRLIR